MRSAQTSSIAVGDITIGSDRQAVTIVRRQTEGGETVEVVIGLRTLTWSDVDGVRALPLPTDAERLLIERLTFDSPDQFVLAQLRGASYFTVAQNVRPVDAGDNYNGPLWTVVRVNDPQQNEEIRPRSRWRLYYINLTTGLIDRIVCQLSGQTVEAQLEWMNQNGEQIPSHISWSANGEQVMAYQLRSFSQTQ